MQKHPRKVLLNKAGDVAHRAIVLGCIGLSFYGMYGIGAWFYNFHNISEEFKKESLKQAIDKLNAQDGIEIKDTAKDMST